MNKQAGETKGGFDLPCTNQDGMITTYHPEILTSPGWSKFGYRKWSIFGCFFQG